MRKLIFIAFNMHAAHGAYQQCREVSAASLCLADSPLPERELELELVLELELEQWLLSFAGWLWFVVRCLFLVAHLLDASCQICDCQR